jgi:ABC-type multidrug transport system ATPase subunit
MNAVIQASGLGKAYRRTWALRDCTLAIPEGHVVGLVGPNGAGKTTRARARIRAPAHRGRRRAPSPSLTAWPATASEAITYQPASRYWRFQWTETAIYPALAGYCFRRLSRLS